MKRILTILALLFLTTGMIFAQTGVFISEYIEGSSSNKALEIYNGTGADIDFTNYRMLRANNGKATSDTLNFVGTLTAGDVYVIANSSADQAILDVADTTSSITYYNGDDYLGLEYFNGTDWVVIDVIGYLGVDPGSGWDVAGTTAATANHTLVRKTSVTTGKIDWALSAGTDATDSEWEVYDQDTFDYLGQHPGTGAPEIPNLFISEYIEGSSNNKAMEIYNASDNTVDLTKFIIRNSHNADGWSSAHVFPAGATLASHAVWVMVADQVDPALFDSTNADEVIPYSSDSPVHYNGDDARALAYVNGTDTTNVDVIGDPNLDPGSAWTVDDTTNATKDHTLVRKSSVTAGQTDWATSAGTDDASSEWDIYAKNTFDYLGQHPGTGTPEIPNLFISEYIEGSSNNKAMEIYNASDNTVDLTKFIIRNSHNADGWSSVHAFPGGATLASHDVWVMVADQVDPALFDVANADEVIPYSSDSPVHFNGDDARALAYVNGTDTTNVDVIGDPNLDPGSAWTVGDTTNATKDHTLVRKSSVTTGQMDWVTSAGTDDASSEWDIYAKNTFDYLGQHPGTGGGGGGLPVVQTVSRDILVPDAGQAVTVSAYTYADAGLASVDLVYSTNGVDFSDLPMTLVSDSTYSVLIPGTTFADTTFLGYFVVATDNNAQADTSDIYGFFTGITPIDRVKDMANQDPTDTFIFAEIAARIKGVCTAGSNNFSSGRIEAYLQDTTAAIKIFTFASDTPEMVEGNDYTVAGVMDEFHGQSELVPQTLPDDIVDNGASTVPDATVLTINELLNDSERYESMLITVNDATLNAATPWVFSGGSGATFYINDGSASDSLALRIDADTDVMDAPEPTWPENITGLVAQYDAYQLLPRRLADFDPATGVDDENTALPKTYSLDQNYPNPFNPTTTIKFSLPQNGFVTLKVYDMLGREVATLVNREMQASFKTIVFDASNLASGVYVYRLKVNDFTSAKKLLLMK